MAVTVAVDNPSYPKDVTFSIDHLGEIPNGGSLEVSEESERMFISARGQTVADAFKGHQFVKVSGSSTVKNAKEILADKTQPGLDQGVSVPEKESKTSTDEGEVST